MWVEHTIAEILAVFLDNKRKKEWIPRLKTTWYEEKVDELGSRIEYGEILVPWPFSNRDVLAKIETEILDNVNHVRLKAYSVKNDRVIKPGNVRAIVHPSYLDLKYDPIKKETLLETITFTDPAGFIPAWIVNLFQKDEAKILAVKLKMQLAKNLYSKDQLNLIEHNLNKIFVNNNLKKQK